MHDRWRGGLKILQIVPYFLPYHGGQERYVYNLSKYLVKMGHEVHVATSNYPDNGKDEIIDGITIKRYKCLARPLGNPLTPGMLLLGNEIKKFDIVHTHNEHSFAAMVAAYIRRRTDVPLILTCHGQLIFGSKMADYFEKVYSRIIGRGIFKAADRIISLSSSDLNYISSLGIDSKKISILPNAIDPEELFKLDSGTFEADNPKNSFLQGLNGKRIILFVGPVIQRKGVEYLIKSIPKVLIKTGDDSVFVLVGGGEFLNQARQLTTEMQINDHVIFTGRLTEEELVETYRCADLFVLPSLSEGVPTTILEAMYFGVPVVATDIPGVKDHFKDVALLVPPKNADRLAETIVKLLDDEELTRRLSKAGAELIKGKYTWDVVAKEYEGIYIEMQEGVN